MVEIGDGPPSPAVAGSVKVFVQNWMLVQDPSEKTYQILQTVPSKSADVVELTLKMLLRESAI